MTLTAVQDALDEADETIVVDITAVTNGTEDGRAAGDRDDHRRRRGADGGAVARRHSAGGGGRGGHGDGDAVGGFGPGGDGGLGFTGTAT